MVKNFINNTHYFQWDEQTCAAYFKKVKDVVEITIPKLNEMACEQVDLASVPYLSFIANSDFHRPEHLYAWKTLLRSEKNVGSHQADRSGCGAGAGRFNPATAGGNGMTTGAPTRGAPARLQWQA